MRKFIILIFLLNSFFSFSQTNEWKSWDENYRVVKYADLMNFERNYADSVEKDLTITQYYSRIDKYRISGTYLGKKRRIDTTTLASMKRVFKLFVGKSPEVENIVNSEYLFDVGGFEIWMPLQKVLESDFESEVRPKEELTLYCLFLNEHGTEKELYNTLFISEFRTH